MALAYTVLVPQKGGGITLRKPIRGNVQMALTDEQIIELRKIYKQIRQVKYSHAYAMLCLADTTKEERAFFAALGDINNGRSYEEEQAEVGRILQLIDDGTPWYEAQEDASDRIVPVYLTAEEKSIAKRYAAAKGITLPEACKEALFEKIEDEYDSAVAEEAYTEYVASGCKSTPAEELWQELGLDDEDEIEEKLQEAEQEAELTDQRYSSGEVLQAMRETMESPAWVVKEVQPKEDYTLLLTFADGSKKIYNAQPLLEKAIYAPLKDIAFFLCAKAECGTVVWHDEIDIAPECLWANGVPVSVEMSDEMSDEPKPDQF